jgi:hypothetical protein
VGCLLRQIPWQQRAHEGPFLPEHASTLVPDAVGFGEVRICAEPDAQSRQRYESALLAAGFNGVHEQSLDYTGRLSFDELIGGLYSAMPSQLLPPPAQRAAFTDHIRNALGAGDQFTEQVHLAALVGYSPPPPSAH